METYWCIYINIYIYIYLCVCIYISIYTYIYINFCEVAWGLDIDSRVFFKKVNLHKTFLPPQRQAGEREMQRWESQPWVGGFVGKGGIYPPWKLTANASENRSSQFHLPFSSIFLAVSSRVDTFTENVGPPSKWHPSEWRVTCSSQHIRNQQAGASVEW